MPFECKKCEKTIEVEEGVIDEHRLAELRVFLKKHKKHAIFHWHDNDG